MPEWLALTISTVLAGAAGISLTMAVVATAQQWASKKDRELIFNIGPWWLRIEIDKEGVGFELLRVRGPRSH